VSACTDFRRAVLTDPLAIEAGLRAHARSCADCAAFARRAAGFEERLARALAVGFPGARSGIGRRGWLAIAASVTLAIGAVTGLWLAVPGPSLAADVVAHMAGEPQAWRVTDVAVPDGALQPVMRDARLHLTGAAGVVSYANSCSFRGHRVPHLVVQTDHGPVTVMVLVHESTSRPVQFDESGYRGVILPVSGHGSIAVLARGGADEAPDMAVVGRIAARVLDSIVWG
jgi:hypothetical protein